MRRLGTKHLTAAEFAEPLDDLFRSALIFAEEQAWIRSRRAMGFKSDVGSRLMLG